MRCATESSGVPGWRCRKSASGHGASEGWTGARGTTVAPVGPYTWPSTPGVNFVDTAYGYGKGRSEALIGQVLRDLGAGPKPIVATKVPLKTGVWPATDDMAVEDCYPASWIRGCTEKSLRRLGVDRIDLQQFHFWADAWTEHGGWRETVADLKREGKVRSFGVSANDHEPDSVLRVLDTGAMDTVQVIYNVFDPSASERLLPKCSALDIGVIARSPFDEGSLTGTLRADTVFAEGRLAPRLLPG